MTNLYVHNAIICNPFEQEQLGSLWVTNGKIESVIYDGEEPPDLPPQHERLDAERLRVAPGFIDVHVHGGGGVDVMHADASDLARMSKFHASHGTTSFLATTLTANQDDLIRAVKVIHDAMGSKMPGAHLAGIHLEGPFLNKKRIGAQNPQHARLGTIEELRALIEASGGNIRLLTLAPELEGAEALVRFASAEGITVSIGHSDATYDQVKQAVAWGSTHITHLFNGMRELHHREPGVAGASLIVDDLAVEVICDGVHVHPDLVQLVFRAKPKDKIMFITDCISAAGMKDGEYELGGLPIIVSDGQARLIDQAGNAGGLAGSCLTLDKAFQNGLHFTQKSFSDILATLTINPAKQVGLAETKGTLVAGKDADFIIVDHQNKIKATFVGGHRVYG